ncbi:MAG: pyridoxamine 5'-phosphate oxidase family protein [Candidatus Korobacteraceae bacterium]
MGTALDNITPELQAFLLAQPVFFVATAPMGAEGRVNLSPKGLDTFRVLSPSCVAYLDLTGSGNETAAHLLENGRITFMFCAFEGPPRIVRLYGQGRVIARGNNEWEPMAALFPGFQGTRQFMVADLDRVQTSCGFGVPRMKLEAPRDTLEAWAVKKGVDGLRDYRARKNARSIDGLHAPPTDEVP